MKFKIIRASLVFASLFSFSILASATLEPKVVNYKLNGKEESVKLNPSRGDVVNIEINTNVLVKFSRIYICKTTDSKCNDDDDSSVIFFTTTSNSYTSSVIKPWYGKPSDTKMSRGVVVSDGDYKIKVKMKDEASSEYKYIQELSPHIITIDSNYSGGSGGSSSSSSESSSGQSQSAPPSEIASVETSPSFISTHSSPEDLSSSSKSSARFEASSGRARLAYSGAPIAFSGEAVIPKESEGQGVRFVWSFGDGSAAEGKKVSHIYKFAGDYAVVLNAYLSDVSAVSRTSVKVVNPSVVISNVSGDSVEIWNQGIFEINLNGWLISNDRSKFIFPMDTIIASSKKIAIPDEYMKLNLAEGGKVSLFNPSQKEISSHYGPAGNGEFTAAVSQNAPSNLDNDPVVMKIRDFIAKTDKESAEKKNNFSESETTVKSANKIATDTDTKDRDNARVDNSDEFSKAREKGLPSDGDKTVSSSAQTAAIASSQDFDRGLMRSLLNLPSSGFDLVKRLFYSGN